MKDEPDIVKEMKEAEKSGNLTTQTRTSNEYAYRVSQTTEDNKEQEEDKGFTGGYKRENLNIDLGDLEEKYKTIFENFTVAITLADEKERIISWNKYAEEIFNMNQKDLYLRNVRTLYPDNEWRIIREKNIRQKGMKYKMETKILRKNKTPIDVEISLCVLKGLNDKTVGSLAIIKDISKLKTIERKLLDTEERYRTIFENSAVAIMLTDENEQIISWNRYTENLLKMDEAELHLKPVKSIYPSDEWSKIRSENIRKKGMQHHLETKIKTKEGKIIDVDISISVLKNHKGEVIGSIGVIKDITNRKQIEDELSFKHELLESLLDNIPDCIYFKDRDSRFIKVNKAKALRSGTTPEEMIGKTEYDFFPKDVAESNINDDKEVIKFGKPIINKIEKRKNNKEIDHWISIIKVPRFDNAGNVIGIMGINRDITEIKKSEERYKNLFETAIDPIIILDHKGVFLDINKQVSRLLGYSKEEIIGKTYTNIDILSDDSKKVVSENFIKRMKGEEVPPYEIKVITKSHEVIPAEINANPIYENGKIIGDLIIIRDIRERYNRKKVEKELYESEKKFEDIFNATSDVMIYLEKEIILDINNAALNLGSFNKKELVGKHITKLKGMFFDEDIKKHTDAIKKVDIGSKVNDYESEIIIKNGMRFKFLFTADCIRRDGDIKGILLRGKDITQRQRAFDELVRLEEKYRVLAETSADGVITIDPLGRLTYVNPAFEKMINRRKSKILATLFRDYLSDDSIYFFQQIFIDSRKQNEKIENVELELALPNGNTIPIEVNIAPFVKENEFAGMVLTVRDITERRRIEDELKKSERLKTEFMNIAAHELKSPVTPIKGYLDLIISDKNTSKKIKDWAKVSLRNAERLLGLVNDILDVSRLDTDTMRFEMEKLNTVEILDEIVEDMKPVIENKNIKFISQIPKTLPSIMGDRFRLSQVLKNLFVNAIKFTDNGSISIITEKKNDHILIKIIDSGIGISKDEVKKVFNKFYQAYTGDDRKNEGTGLGLFICKEIIEKHGGTIWVESTLGKGSTFYIKLPYLHKMVVNLKNNKT